MKKKLLVLLLIAALAAFVFTGCTPPTPSEGEGEGEGEIEGVVVDIDSMVEIDGRNYVKGDENLDITVTFPAPVSGVVTADISDCSGDYSKGPVALFPNGDKTVWTGKVTFHCEGYTYGGPCEKDTCEPLPCCASVVTVNAGECGEDGICLQFPVIVDCKPPYLGLVVKVDECYCAGCEVSFESHSIKDICAGTDECCGDDCSGLAGWAISIYDLDKNPFDKCCDLTCAEPIWTASGDACPVDAVTDCLEDNTDGYLVVATVEDNVGNISKGVFVIKVDETGDECCITITECEDDCCTEEPLKDYVLECEEDFCKVKQDDPCKWYVILGDNVCKLCEAG